MITVERGIEFLRDDCGAELAEYALVLTAFTLLSMAAVHVIGTTANQNVEADSTNFSSSLSNSTQYGF